MQPNAILELKNLSKYFLISEGFLGLSKKYLYALDGINLRLEKGKVLGIVGESGCGKSTLGRVILKLLEASSGQIIFDGQDVTKWSPSHFRPIRNRLQMIFQDPFASLNPRFSVQRILEEPFDIQNLYPRKEERQELILSLLNDVGLSPQALKKYPHEFSGGQRQRIGIARALALKPELIVCDEPVSALDVSIQSQILNLMVDLKEKYHLSYLFIAHDLAVIEHIADDVAVMYLGRIVEYGPVQQVCQNPTHPYTKALLESMPRLDVIQKRLYTPIQGDIPTPLSPPSGCRFHTRCPLAQKICKEKTPLLENKGTHATPHWAACHFC